ncbi:hypothetical protein QT974_34105, partial [Microcoleus sp. herbarium12]
PVELDVEATVNQIGRQGILLSLVLVPRRVNRSQLLLLIDCGGYSEERVELTAAFLQQIKAKVRYVAWLNPMPESCWEGTTAGKVARGLQRAITLLRAIAPPHAVSFIEYAGGDRAFISSLCRFGGKKAVKKSLSAIEHFENASRVPSRS